MTQNVKSAEDNTGTEFKSAFDYSEISENDKHVVDEIIRRYGHPEAETIRKDFGMTEVREYDESQSTFLKAVAAAGIKAHYQGHNVQDGVKYSMYGVMGEIRHLNKITDMLIETVLKMVQEEDD
jgi:hypothetical protein